MAGRYDKNWHEGETVHVYSKWGTDRGLARIVKVLKTRVVLDDGRRFDLEGNYLNHTGRGPCAHIAKEV